MADESTEQKVSPQLDTGTRLAIERTFIAHERTQMAWVRTALSLISFGFTIAKLFEVLREKLGNKGPVLGPRVVGILMISMGLFSMIIADVLHRQAIQRLRAQCPDLPISLAGMMAALIGLLGVLALISAFIRL